MVHKKLLTVFEWIETLLILIKSHKFLYGDLRSPMVNLWPIFFFFHIITCAELSSCGLMNLYAHNFLLIRFVFPFPFDVSKHNHIIILSVMFRKCLHKQCRYVLRSRIKDENDIDFMNWLMNVILKIAIESIYFNEKVFVTKID